MPHEPFNIYVNDFKFNSFSFLIKKWVVDVLLYSPPIGLGTIIK